MGRKDDDSQGLQSYVELMISHQDALRAFIYSQLPNSPDVGDVLQNTNAILWQKRNRFKDGTNFRAWAFKIARYQVQHQRDRSRRDGRLIFSDKLVDLIATTAPTDQPREGLLSALEGCMTKLSDKQRDIVHARYTPGNSLEQHAEKTSSSPGSLRIALHRIRDLLKRCVEETLARESA